MSKSISTARVPLRRFVVLAILCLSMIPLVITSASTAEAAPKSPCPRYSISDIHADPDGDWDRDGISNNDELYHLGLDPCVHDSQDHCNSGSPYCKYRYEKTVNRLCSSVHWRFFAFEVFPEADFDHDGVSNLDEFFAGTNPCKFDAPKTVSWSPCPAWTAQHVYNDPNGDWDKDGRSNIHELNYRTNPCAYDYTVFYYAPAPAPTVRLPHVTVKPTAPAPRPTPAPTRQVTCPANYPYYHYRTGLCYANPIPNY